MVALSGVIFVVSDWSTIQPALAQANWGPLPFALLATVISYFCVSISFAKVSQLHGVVMKTRELSIVGFISSALNHIVLSGGAAGYSVRFMLMKRYGVTMREVMAISIMHFYLTALWMVTVLPVSMIYLGLNAPLNQTTANLLAMSGALLLVGTVLITILIFSSRWRKKAIGIFDRVIRAVARRDMSAHLERFDATMEHGIAAIRKQPSSLVAIAVLVVVDWACSAAALWFFFRAFDLAPSLGQLVSGFVIGTMAGVSSALPGGMGVQEASMTGIFALFGFPAERAALVAILYRVVYSILPYLVSLGFYRLILNHSNKSKRLYVGEADY